jgi:hypothetical protein
MTNIAIEREWVPEAIRCRLPVDFPVTLEVTGSDRRETGAVANLSLRGMFAATRVLLPVNAPLRVIFCLPLATGPRTYAVAARVRWVNDPSAPRAPELPGGMGLEFVGLDGGSRSDLERFLEELVSTGGV